ncbi:apolipoprotein N-acyltransferase [Cellulomonas fimi]|uniref:Apolipoprotein N-acyltransferase n=1 Tax=Cellulomonas fimi TaxID=1708 RepID=A0A7Y0M307_CELFI|nr:apolipoprotein N-acyltransferase [Cellulomonas fimi]
MNALNLSASSPRPSRTKLPEGADVRLEPAAGQRTGLGTSLLLAALGGLVTETAFPSKSWWPMAFVGVALLLLALRRDSARGALLTGSAFGLGFFLPHLWWANEAVGQPIGWIALSVMEASTVGIFGVVWIWARRAPWVQSRAWLQVLVCSVLWVAVEQLRGRWPFGGFPWGYLAFSQTEGPLLPVASLGGTTLVSGAVVVVGALVALAIDHLRRREVRRAGAALGLAVVPVLAPLLINLDGQEEVGSVRVGVVQGNVPTRGAEAMSQARAVLANHVAGTRQLLDDVAPGELDLVLWPESASDIDPRSDAQAGEAVDAAARSVGAPILLGTQRFLPETRYNDYILWEPGRGSDVSYTKQHPVPFGEYIPYRDLFRRLTSAVDLVTTDMAAGTEMALLPVDVARLGRTVPITTAICFEVAYDELIRESVLAGGELIVIPTNNASFGMTQESTQQLAMSRFRAVEHGRAVVQVSTVGVSGIISPTGELQQSTELFTSAAMIQELPLRTTLTLADRLGGWPAAVVQVAAVVALAAGVLASARGRRRAVRAGGGHDSDGQARDRRRSARPATAPEPTD